MKIWKVRDIISYIETDGWYMVSQKGSHRQFKHPIKKGRVTVPGALNDDLPPGTSKSILTQAGLYGDASNR
ncbi:MAG: type II toxin-antitoxin system HicA family toxin [Dysgonamonadaceae bacterium]|jgi:predicted RNA binding protein YcfA (HicA-like mRNA interferase family)|nr:type II toxin-antitoxin system HicA family toxin [Dysgonamonadaceae bacterium]